MAYAPSAMLTKSLTLRSTAHIAPHGLTHDHRNLPSVVAPRSSQRPLPSLLTPLPFIMDSAATLYPSPTVYDLSSPGPLQPYYKLSVQSFLVSAPPYSIETKLLVHLSLRVAHSSFCPSSFLRSRCKAPRPGVFTLSLFSSPLSPPHAISSGLTSKRVT